MRPCFTLLAVGFAAVVLTASTARAVLPDENQPTLDEHTALELGARTLKLGVLAFEYGITNRVTVGTDPPAWLVRAATQVWVPNLHVKAIAYRRGPLTLAGRAAFYFADISNGNASGNLYVVPLSAFASYQIGPRVWAHGELTYVIAAASGAGDVHRTTIGGSAATRSLQLGAMAEYRLYPKIALTLRGRIALYTGPLAFSGDSAEDPFTSVDVEARLEPRHDHPWMILPGIAFLWQRVRFSVGVGYGNYFVPGLDIPLTHKSVVPDASLALLL